MPRGANGIFYFSPKYELVEFSYHDEVSRRYDIEDVKRELGWSNTHSRTGYFEKLLAEHNEERGYWYIYDQGRPDPPDYIWMRTFTGCDLVRFLRVYADKMPDKIKKKKEYWERAQAALEFAEDIEKRGDEEDGY